MEKVSKKQGRSIDMTNGNPYKLLFMFSIPLLIGNVLQQLYNMVDSIVVGNVVGAKALAAVGTGFPIIFMMCSFSMGVGTGATIMISQYFGAKDMVNLQKTVSTIYKGLLIAVVPVAIIGAIISRPLLVLMQVPNDGTLDMAVTYMVVIFLGMIFTMGYNINSGILQGFGDSRTSLIFLAISTVLNIILDVLFTAGFKWGVFGVAFATVLAQMSSWLIGVRYIQKRYTIIKLNFRHMEFDWSIFKQALKLGIPSALQNVCFSLGTMVTQALVNSYGSTFMAGFNGANKIDSFAFMPIQSFSIAITTYVGQNMGAHRIDRVKKGVRSALVMSGITAVALSAILYPLSGTLMRMFSQEAGVIEAGVIYLTTVLPFYIILAFNFVYSSALRGAGEMMVPLIAAVVSLWLLRVPAGYLLAYFAGKEYIYYSYSIAWLCGLIFAWVAYIRGKWQTKSIVKMEEVQG